MKGTRKGVFYIAKLSNELKVVKKAIINGYVLKTKKDQQEIADIMAAETWYIGQQAIENSFCDTVMFEEIEFFRGL